MTGHTHTKLIISRTAQQTLFEDLYKRPKIEACGVLLGAIDEQGNWLVEQAHPMRNIFSSPVYFEFDPEELLLVELTYPEQVIGVYHSHPTGFPKASDTDYKNMKRVNEEQHIPWVWLIASGPFTAAAHEQSGGELARTPVIAYHYYAGEGLQQITIIMQP